MAGVKWIPIVMVMSLLSVIFPSNLALASNGVWEFTAQYRQDVPVTLDVSAASEISTLDPALASDTVSVNVIENLFLGLTNVDPVTSQIAPELATSWEVSGDGMTWTFHLRQDVLWMHYDPASQTATKLRPVVASDVIYGIKRTCDPRLGGYYGTIEAKVIAGCDVVNQTPADDVTDELVYGKTIQVAAPDEKTVIMQLLFPAGFFLSMTPLWMFRPVPQEVVQEFGDEWTQPGNLVTNGPYFAAEVTRGVRRVFVSNPRLPDDLRGDGNIDVINSVVSEDGGTTFALYQDHQIDTAPIPVAEFQSLLADPEYQAQILQVFDLGVFYFGFIHDKPPFDDVHVRRAFSAIIDRDTFIAQLRSGRGLPMIHFTPPGIAHAPPINEIGVGFNPEYARNEMALGGYPNCEGLPEVNIVTYSGAGNWAEFWASAAERYLGCAGQIFNIEQVEFSVLLRLVDNSAPIEDRPNAFTLGWSPTYSDANTFINDVLSCTSENRFQRLCSEVDELIDQAARENDPAIRDELYAEIEDAFFGAEGIFPMAPLFMRSDYVLVKPWYTGPFQTDGLFGGGHWDARQIDMAAKLAARG